MSDPRRLMARLNPSGMRFGASFGGIPELTPQDIAAALGMLRDPGDPEKKRPLDPFAREVFCAIWWQDGARLNEKELLALIGVKQYAEMGRQQRALQIARLDLHIAQDGIAAKEGGATLSEKRTRDRLESRVAELKKAAWPGQPDVYPKIRSAALAEVVRPEHCPQCKGRGAFKSDAVVVVCQQCDGTGAGLVSDRQRAGHIERDPKAYRETWKPVYEWTYALIRDGEADAIKAMRFATSEIAA